MKLQSFSRPVISASALRPGAKVDRVDLVAVVGALGGGDDSQRPSSLTLA